jgi:hypothetical protein
MQADGTAQRCASGELHMRKAGVVGHSYPNALCSTAVFPRLMCVCHACSVVHAAKCRGCSKGERELEMGRAIRRRRVRRRDLSALSRGGCAMGGTG